MSKRTRLSADQRREVIERAATEVFAERGYGGASIDEIARRSEVSAPVVYDHFASKADLHRQLFERHRDELVAVWREHLLTDDPPAAHPAGDRRLGAVRRSHPYAWKMLFRETTGDPEAEAVHREVLAGSRALLAPLVVAQPGGDQLPHAEMAAELIRSALTGLALWWQDHPEVPRDDVVATAVGALGRLRAVVARVAEMCETGGVYGRAGRGGWNGPRRGEGPSSPSATRCSPRRPTRRRWPTTFARLRPGWTSTSSRARALHVTAPSAQLELRLMAAWVGRARLLRMDEIQNIAAVIIGCGAAVVFALMAWAGQHRASPQVARAGGGRLPRRPAR